MPIPCHFNIVETARGNRGTKKKVLVLDKE